MQLLLDAVETRQRRIQHGLVLLGVMFLFAALIALGKSRDLNATGVVLAALGIAVLAAGMRVKVKWVVTYKAHVIRFENDPLSGEKLYIDDELVARGGLGIHMLLQGHIRSGDGANDRIEATSRAGLLSFSCKITAHPAGK